MKYGTVKFSRRTNSKNLLLIFPFNLVSHFSVKILNDFIVFCFYLVLFLGLVQELQKASSERADILSSYCDKVQSLAYQKSQPFVPYNNQVSDLINS